MQPEVAIDHRRVYSRGLFDGLRMAGIDNPEDFLSAAKLERVERELSGIVRKVFEALPASEPWSPSQVLAEMARQTGSRPEHRAVTACLGQLVERGLAKEPTRGLFVRAHTKPQLAAVPQATASVPSLPCAREEAPAMSKPITAEKSNSADPMDRLAALASTLKGLGAQVSQIAREVEDVAIGVEERVQRIHADTEKLRQLQALLKDIGQ